ncbi:MAG: 30S ribosomal protein S1 [Thermodesulfobacteriota bacterium]
MTDEFTAPGDNPEDESFAELFENYMGEVKDDLQVGEEITGDILSIGDDSVFVNTGSKVDGVVDKQELMDENGELACQVGDPVKLYVVSKAEGEVRLSKALTGAGGLHRLHEAQRNAIPVEGRVTETCKGGFRVNVLGQSGFCPVSQMDVVYVEQPESYVGGTYEFLISRIEERGKNVVLSRRDLLNRYIAEEREKFIQNVSPDDIINGKITKLMPYGAFVEVAPGVEGMVHISEISWQRVSSAEEALAVNEAVEVKILAIEEAKESGKAPKISLSIKQAQGDPWEKIGQRYYAGDRVEGTVTRCADFGAFVEIEPGVEGLVHISEMSHKRVTKPADVVEPGQRVSVSIKDLDPVNRRISLSIKEAEGDPWAGIESRYPVGQAVSGRIEKKEQFGYFVALEPGVVGLLPISKIKSAANASELEKARIDDVITVTVDSIDVNARKISLGPADAGDQKEWQNYRKQAPAASGAGTGDLGEKLKAAMKNKK